MCQQNLSYWFLSTLPSQSFASTQNFSYFSKVEVLILWCWSGSANIKITTRHTKSPKNKHVSQKHDTHRIRIRSKQLCNFFCLPKVNEFLPHKKNGTTTQQTHTHTQITLYNLHINRHYLRAIVCSIQLKPIRIVANCKRICWRKTWKSNLIDWQISVFQSTFEPLPIVDRFIRQSSRKSVVRIGCDFRL